MLSWKASSSAVASVASVAGAPAVRGGQGDGGSGVRAVDQLGESTGLLHERPGDEGRPLGEEVQQMQGGDIQQQAVQPGAVVRQLPGGLGHRPAESPGELGREETGGIEIVHLDLGEGVQGTGQGGGDGLVLGVGPSGRRPLDEGRGEAVQFLLAQGRLLAGEGEQPGDPDRPVRPARRPARPGRRACGSADRRSGA